MNLIDFINLVRKAVEALNHETVTINKGSGSFIILAPPEYVEYVKGLATVNKLKIPVTVINRKHVVKAKFKAEYVLSIIPKGLENAT